MTVGSGGCSASNISSNTISTDTTVRDVKLPWTYVSSGSTLPAYYCSLNGYCVKDANNEIIEWNQVPSYTTSYGSSRVEYNATLTINGTATINNIVNSKVGDRFIITVVPKLSTLNGKPKSTVILVEITAKGETTSSIKMISSPNTALNLMELYPYDYVIIGLISA